MKSTVSSMSTKWRVGLFSILGILAVGVVTVYVNDRPFWWRSCQYVEINVDDATGLRAKSPVRSLGLQIGFIKNVTLSETQVTLGLCLTASEPSGWGSGHWQDKRSTPMSFPK